LFGERLKSLREDKDLLQRDIAEIIGVSDRTIGMYEQERREPGIETLKKFADYFNVTLDYLTGRVDNKEDMYINHRVDGHDYELEVNAKAYPNGMTHEEVIEVLKALEKLKDAGFDLLPKKIKK